MKKKILLIIIFIVAILSIVVGVLFSVDDSPKEKIVKCSLAKKDNYYVLDYKTNYENYSVVDDYYKVISNKKDLDKLLKNVKFKKIENIVDFSKENLLVVEVLTNYKVDEVKFNKDSIRVIAFYKLNDGEKKDTYNILLIPIDKKIDKYDVRVSPITTGEEPETAISDE